MHGLRATEHAQGREQAYQTEAVVAVQVRDEDIVQPRRPCPEPLHGNLHTLATVNHKRLVAQIQYLPRWRVRHRRLRTTAT